MFQNSTWFWSLAFGLYLKNEQFHAHSQKYLNTKKRVREPVSIINTTGTAIDNNVILNYKNGESRSFLILVDNLNNELTYYSNENTTIAYKINKENTEKILELLNKNKL